MLHACRGTHQRERWQTRQRVVLSKSAVDGRSVDIKRIFDEGMNTMRETGEEREVDVTGLALSLSWLKEGPTGAGLRCVEAATNPDCYDL